MNKIANIDYDEVDFVWIADHWDLHLKGLCKYGGELCLFQTIRGEYDFDQEEYIIPDICNIFSLSLLEKIRWIFRKRLFEICIGYHWTYPYRKTGGRPFKYRNPKWLYKFIFKTYYKLKLGRYK